MTRRRGFTMIELLISLVLMGIVMAGALRMFRTVSTAVSGTVDRQDAMQNLRFGVSQIDLLLRNAGAGVTDIQPTLVYISANVVAFNADWISPIPNSPTAVNYNPDVLPNAANAVTTAQVFGIPTSSPNVNYPDSTYRTAGALSPAETIVYYFELDTSTARTDDYHLMRQVNNNAPDEVARNILPYPGRPFFEWLRTDAAGALQTVAAASLPWRHIRPVHGDLNDTNSVAQIDSIRAVRLNMRATNGLTAPREIVRDLVTTTRIPNAGLTKQRSCGDAPIFGQTVTAVWLGTPGSPLVRIAWTAATDETGGETDVERYLIYRRSGGGAFDDALQTVPAGQATYTFDDTNLLKDTTYTWGITALDCTPQESSLRSSNAIGPIP